MEARELRIGNWVKSKQPFEDVIYLGCQSNSVDFNINGIEPIPLTKEWLVKLGFVLDKGVGVWFGEGDLSDDYGCFTIWDKYTGINYKFSIENSLYIELKYVHQLQNLYFALTGEELTIK
jgi:hypothetical protein